MYLTNTRVYTGLGWCSPVLLWGHIVGHIQNYTLDLDSLLNMIVVHFTSTVGSSIIEIVVIVVVVDLVLPFGVVFVVG